MRGREGRSGPDHNDPRVLYPMGGHRAARELADGDDHRGTTKCPAGETLHPRRADLERVGHDHHANAKEPRHKITRRPEKNVAANDDVRRTA